VDLRHPHQTDVGEGGGQVTVFPQQPPNRLDLICHLKRADQFAAVNEFEDAVGVEASPFEQKERLGEDRLAAQQGSGEFAKAIAASPVMLRIAVKGCHQRSGVCDDLCHSPNPVKWAELVARS
jgi:hypothetical protein